MRPFDPKTDPAYMLVPTNLHDNLQFRIALYKKCWEDTQFRAGVVEICRQDVLFFFNAFCWVYEPRPRSLADGTPLPKKMPFIAWEHQVPAILEIRKNLGYEDVGLEKSRGEGASWVSVLFGAHDFIFHPNSSIGFISKDESSVVDQNNPDSLFWKFQFTLDNIPVWMGGVSGKDYKRNISKNNFINLRNGSTLSGFASTGDVASGGRKTWMLMDELAKFPRPSDEDAMASTQHVTESRLVVSTPKGSSGAYYNLMHEPSSLVKVILDWKQNPTRNRGLYELIDGVPVAVDPANNPLPPEYNPPTQEILERFTRLRRKGFKLEGKLRSAWYDKECDRPMATPQNIAQELDRDYGGSAYRVFGESFFTKCESMVCPPVLEGDFDYNTEDLSDGRFIKTDGGPLKLWVPLDMNGRPPHGHFVLGCDVCAGTGGSYSSNSTIFGTDIITGEQVLEYACNTINPSDFADLSIALAKWMYEAFLAWEKNGPGAAYTNQVIKRQYDNVYYRRVIFKKSLTNTNEPGWWTDQKTKEVMFMDLQTSVIMNEVVIRSRQTLNECSQYVRKEGLIHHALVKNADDSKGASHGDRVIGACVCIQGVRERPLSREHEEEIHQSAPVGSMAHRMMQYADEEAKNKDEWTSGVFAGN